MGQPITNMFDLEAVIGDWIRIIGVGIDIFGVLIIVVGIAWSTSQFLGQHMEEQHYDRYKIRVGRSLLLGLEMLVAADIVKTIALEPSFMSLGVLAGLVVVRTFLSWTLVLEIDGRWPWQAEPALAPGALGARMTGPLGHAARKQGAEIEIRSGLQPTSGAHAATSAQADGWRTREG